MATPIKKTEATDNFTPFLCGLIRDVMIGHRTMADAEKMLRAYVLEDLSDEESAAWKEKAVEHSRKLMQVAEGFSQAIIVVGSRQGG